MYLHILSNLKPVSTDSWHYKGNSLLLMRPYKLSQLQLHSTLNIEICDLLNNSYVLYLILLNFVKPTSHVLISLPVAVLQKAVWTSFVQNPVPGWECRPCASPSVLSVPTLNRKTRHLLHLWFSDANSKNLIDLYKTITSTAALSSFTKDVIKFHLGLSSS